MAIHEPMNIARRTNQEGCIVCHAPAGSSDLIDSKLSHTALLILNPTHQNYGDYANRILPAFAVLDNFRRTAPSSQLLRRSSSSPSLALVKVASKVDGKLDYDHDGRCESSVVCILVIPYHTMSYRMF